MVEFLIALLSVKDVAHKLGTSTRFVWGLRDAGKLPAPIKLGRLCKWRLSDIEEWIAQGCPTCRPAAQGPRSKGVRP